mmetsp:Transcript_89170/g.133682  ORF Transcript_89170/g.133682 Transcript_89170/m.133682 type:complete len:93 (+) Transcript_89170:33-311(+)
MGAETKELWVAGGFVKYIVIWTVLWCIAQTVPDPPEKKTLSPQAQEELKKIEDRAAAKEALLQLKKATANAEELKTLEEELKKIEQKAGKLD